MSARGKKESFLFEREMSRKLELMVIRNWDDVASRQGWRGRPESTRLRVRLYIHEVFALDAWRRRDGTAGKKTCTVVDISASNKRSYIPHLAVADQFLRKGEAMVGAMPNGQEKNDMLLAVTYSRDWYHHVQRKIQ